jgi:hypothetical protein
MRPRNVTVGRQWLVRPRTPTWRDCSATGGSSDRRGSAGADRPDRARRRRGLFGNALADARGGPARRGRRRRHAGQRRRRYPGGAARRPRAVPQRPDRTVPGCRQGRARRPRRPPAPRSGPLRSAARTAASDRLGLPRVCAGAGPAAHIARTSLLRGPARPAQRDSGPIRVASAPASPSTSPRPAKQCRTA